jgi:hypothetical protein
MLTNVPPGAIQPLSGAASSTDILTALKSISTSINTAASAIGDIAGTLPSGLIYQGQLPTSVGLLYTASSAIPSLLTSINICNTTAGAITLFLFVVPAGVTPAAANAIYYGYSVAANTTTSPNWSIIVPAGYSLYGYSGSAGITLTISGNNAV